MSFGNNERHHLQAYFCIYSFLARKARLTSINVMTDRPEFYKNIKNQLNLIPVEPHTLSEWKGKYDFFWRIKIKAIGSICAEYPGEPVLYVDTDTFLFRDFEEVYRIVDRGHAGMHINEAPLKDVPTRTARRMYRQLKVRAKATIGDLSGFNMWNAGIVLTPNTRQLAEIDLALRLCDEMLAENITDQFIEQYSLAIALHVTFGLEPLENIIAHYWSNKDEWNLLITGFFQHCFLENLSVEEIMARFNRINLGSLPVYRKIRRTKLRFRRTVDRLFPDRDLSYLDIPQS